MYENVAHNIDKWRIFNDLMDFFIQNEFSLEENQNMAYKNKHLDLIEVIIFRLQLEVFKMKQKQPLGASDLRVENLNELSWLQ